jgi:hypothetical protein
MKIATRIDLPPEAVALYQSGASIKAVADQFGCSYDGARMALSRAGVEFRQFHTRPVRVPVTIPRCGDCGERLDRPHPSGLGPHLPGCGAVAR